MLTIGSKVKINIIDQASDNPELDLLLNMQLGKIIRINDYIFPYVVEFENEKLNKLMNYTPRQFAEYELQSL